MKKKRFLSALLAFAMVLSLCPVGLFGHAHAADGDAIDVNGKSEDTTVFYKYEPNSKDTSVKHGATNMPINFKENVANQHAQYMYPADFFDADNTNVTIGGQSGKYITKLELMLSGNYNAAAVEKVMSNITIKLGTSDRQVATTDVDKVVRHQLTPVYKNANQYFITEGLVEVFSGKPKIVSGGGIDGYDVLVFEFETPFLYDAGNETLKKALIVDIVMEQACNLNSSTYRTAGQGGFAYHTGDADNNRRLAIAVNGTGQNDHPVARFTFATENVTVTRTDTDGGVPEISVRDNVNGINLDSSYYDVTYNTADGSAPTTAGTYTMTLNFKNGYTGTKTLGFTIEAGSGETPDPDPDTPDNPVIPDGDIDASAKYGEDAVIYFKYQPGGKENNQKGAYTIPVNLHQDPTDGYHAQYIYPADYFDADNNSRTFDSQKGGLITKLEYFFADFHFHDYTSGAYNGDENSQNYMDMKALEAQMKEAIQLGKITVKIGVTDKSAYTSASDYVPDSQLTQVFYGSPYIAPYDNIADGGKGTSNDWVDSLIIEFDTPFKYTGGNLVIDITMHEDPDGNAANGFGNVKDYDQKVSNATTDDLGFYYQNVGKNLGIGGDGKVKGWLPRSRVTFSAQENVTVTYDPNEQIFTDDKGSGKYPDISVYDNVNKKPLEKDEHYTVTYKGRNGTNYDEKAAAPSIAGDFTMILTFKNGYSGKKEIPFTVKQGFNVTIDAIPDVYYNGKEQEPTIVVRDSNGKELTPGTHYQVIYSGGKPPKDAGEYTITIREIGGSLGEKNVTFEILKAANTASVSIQGWKFGEDGNDPVYSVGYGNADITYYDGNTKTWSAEVPKNAGNHKVKVEVNESTNYAAASAIYDFTIAARNVDEMVPVDLGFTMNYGTDIADYVPIGLSSQSSASQIIFLESELTSLKNKKITSLTFYCVYTSNNLSLKDPITAPVITVTMGVVGTDHFETRDFISTEGMDTVFSAQGEVKGETLVLTFNKPFEYTGGNLLINFASTRVGYNNFWKFAGVEFSSEDPNRVVVDTGGGAGYLPFLPKTTFGYKSQEPAVTVTPGDNIDKLVSDGNPKAPDLTVKTAAGDLLYEGPLHENDYFAVNYVDKETNGENYSSATAPSLAGTYKAVLTFKGNYEGTRGIEFTIAQGEAMLDITIEGWHQDGFDPDVNKPKVVNNASQGKVTYQYAVKGTDTFYDVDFDDPTTLPKGEHNKNITYVLKATSAANNNYPSITISGMEFTIVGHTIVQEAGKEPTCTEAGYSAYEQCSNCNNYNTKQVLSALGHAIIRHEAQTPTCTEYGWDAYETCSRCNDHNTQYKYKAEHQYSSVTDRCTVCDKLNGLVEFNPLGENNVLLADEGYRNVFSAEVECDGKGTVSLSMGGEEFFYIKDGVLRLCGYQVEGEYLAGRYGVKLTVYRTQQMAIVEVTLPDKNVLSRGTYELISANADRYTITAIAPDVLDVISIKTESVKASAEYDEEVETPVSDFIYNLVTSFTDASHDRAFAWTVSQGNYQGNTMQLRYRVHGTEDEWQYAVIEKVNESVSTAEDYFKADITGLRSGMTYEYQIGTSTSGKWSGLYTFDTAVAAKVTDAFSFVAIGDSHVGATNDTAQAWAKALAGTNPAFMLHVGDMVDAMSGNNYAQWNEFFRTLGTAATRLPLFTTLGNHDMSNLGGNDYYFNLHFNHPNNGGTNQLVWAEDKEQGKISDTNLKVLAENADETFYSFDYGDAHFIVLNSGLYTENVGQDTLLLEAQSAWLEADLEANQHAKWIVVMMHQPGYHRYTGDADISRNALNDVFETNGVDLVIQGHSHLVTRSYPIDENGQPVKTEDPSSITRGDGTVYITVGGTITGYNSKGEPNHDSMGDLNSNKLMLIATPTLEQATYTTVSVTGDKLTVTIKQVDGLVVDEFTIEGDYEGEDHNWTWTEGDYAVTPTCTEGGIKIYKCACGATYEDVTESLGHKLVDIPAKATTCYEDGWQEHKECKRDGCDYTTKVVIQTNGHEWVIDEPREPTCTESGLSEGKHCSVCNYVEIEQKVEDALGHYFVKTATWDTRSEPPTLTVTLSCIDCDVVLKGTAEGNETSRDPGDFHTNQNATITYTATVNLNETNYTESTIINNGVGAHRWSKMWTADENGHYHKCEYTWTEGDSWDEKTYSCEETIDYAPHADAEDDSDHKCDTCGFTMSKCSDVDDDADHNCDICGKENITDHTYGEPEFAWEGYDCTAKVICSCGNEQDVAVTVTSEVTTTATCTVEGIKTYTATAEYGEVTYTSDKQPTENLGLDSTKHENTEEHEQQDATCGANGYTAGTYCEDCDKWISGHEEIPAEHSFSEKWSSDENNHWHDCTECDAVSELGAHSYGDGTCICGATEPTAPPATFAPAFGNGSGNTTVETGTADNGAVTYKFQAGTNTDAAPYVTITAPVDGWKLGEENTFTVASTDNIACVVIIKNGDSYTRIAAETNGTTHSFKATLQTGDEIIVMVKGDATGDGRINNRDITAFKKVKLQGEWSEYELCIMNIYGNDSSIGNREITLIKKVKLGTEELDW